MEQGGIDPSLYFEDDKTYFMSNGTDDFGVSGIVQCEIDIETGKKLTCSKTIWTGSGGRYIEGPHMYKINGKYYLLAAEGGTEFGHMVTYACSDSPYGPFHGYHNNPVLTNRNLGGYEIQGVGHADLIQDNNGDWWMLHLGFRQSGQWEAYHHLGREVFLTPVIFGADGWFTAGDDGTTIKSFDMNNIDSNIIQNEKKCYTFENTEWNKDWIYMRIPNTANYEFAENKLILKGTKVTIDDVASPTFIGLRQKDFNSIEKSVSLNNNKEVTLIIEARNSYYSFGFKYQGEYIKLGTAKTRYLSSEVAGGFTGVIIGLYAYSQDSTNQAKFTNFKCIYN